MNAHRLDLGFVQDVSAQSFGEPGRRTFRLHALVDEGTVDLWLEKEQIVMLGSAIEQLLGRVPEEGTPERGSSNQARFAGELEVKAASLTIGYNGELAGFVVEAGDFISDFDLEKISFVADRSQVGRMLEEIDAIVARSRPRCVLCGAPLTGEAHFCPESNGHASLASGD